MLAESRAGVGGEPLEAGGVGGRSCDDGGVLHRAVLLEGLLDARDGRTLLADCDVDAADLLLRVARLPVRLLVQDRVDADGGLARLAVADDELTLSAADRGHRVDGLDAGLERLLDGLALQHGRGLQLEGAGLVGFDVAESVDRLTERVHDASEEVVAHRHRQNVAGPLDFLALRDAW